MKIRNTLIALGLAMAATSAFAATPQPAAAGAKAKPAKHCVQRSKIGKCEKWSTDAKQDAAKAEKKS
ncbi:hypothetical protein FCE95_16170 [Luteimonas gilva]|jgi:curli biogenesis system outer membrane secretion channel CsgG|uniref:Phosphate starvation-inducible protein PsiF n=1 Tax=Luteimonas gilva TaxID=2572684 RepID=A0A4U5JMY2_9GAMM|nr:hypothetical protein [Luteimonas gilva]TKR29658.1 hypothetical protein FCE95_16170 [Luteimonas gilva]